MKNNYQEYLDNQLKDPEFSAYYKLSKEKVKIEIYLEKLKEEIEKNSDKKIIIRNLNKISRYVRHIAL